MGALDRIVSLMLRAVELAFAVIVAAIMGNFLHQAHGSSWDLGRSIYTEVVAGVSIFLALIWLLPFSRTFAHWPIDIFISLLWWVAFGLLVNLIGWSCSSVFNWYNAASRGHQCGRYKAVIAFAFLSALLWLVSALVGLFWVRRHERPAGDADVPHGRKPWYGRRSRV